METKVVYEWFQAAVKAVAAVAPKSTSKFPTLVSHTLIRTEPPYLTFTATDFEVMLVARIPGQFDGDWSLAVPASAFDIKNKVNQVFMPLYLRPNAETHTLEVAQVGHTGRIKGMQPDEFPATPKGDPTWIACIPGTSLKRAVEFVAEAVGKHSPVIHTAVQGGQLVLTASDGYRVHRATLESQQFTGEFSGPLPVGAWQKVARLLGKADDVAIGTLDKHLVFMFGGKPSYILYALVADSRPLSVETILTQEPIWSISVPAYNLERAVKRARLFADTVELRTARYRDDKAMWGMSAVVDLRAEASEIGSVVSPLAATWEVVPGNRMFRLNAERLYDAVGRIQKVGGDVTLRFGGQFDPIFIEASKPGLSLAAVMFPLTEEPKYKAASYPSEEDQQATERREAEADYRTWLGAALGIAGKVAYEGRAARRQRMILRATFYGGEDVVSFYENQFGR